MNVVELSREEKLFSDIDKLMIHDGEAIDKYEGEVFGDQVQSCINLRDSVHDYLFGDNQPIGLNLPWYGLEDTIKFRPSELTVWNGINGHGKSLLLNQVMIGFLKQGARVAIASLELKPEETIVRMISQTFAIKKSELKEPALDQFFEKAINNLWLYTETGDIQPNRVMAMARYVREELKIDHLVIDSLMKCGILEGDYAGEKKFMNSLQNIAKDTGLHIHLVTHSKKQQDEHANIGKFDISGSAAISNIPDNIMTVKRNKKKELESRMKTPDEETMKKHDAYIVCDKQRHGDWEGVIGLYFHDSGQYTKQQGSHRPLW
ncbi:MAG: DnaB-like helicase C-terminal domain-containing protein [Methylococcales bacterium]